MSFSNSGGTLTIPSPTHVHTVDVVKTLRRSLSRSPSKLSLVRTNSAASNKSLQSEGAGTPQSPCPKRVLISGHQQQQAASLFVSAQAPSTPLGFFTPNSAYSSQQSHPSTTKSSLRLSLRAARAAKAASSRPLSRTRTSPKSPLKRALNLSSDAGNSVSTTPIAPVAQGQENMPTIAHTPRSPTPGRTSERSNRHSMHLDVSGVSSNQHLLNILETGGPFPSATASPLKRSDATMDLEQHSFGSPVAKRRSVHGFATLAASENNTNNVFDSAPTPTRNSSIDLSEDSANFEYTLSGVTARSETPASPTRHHMPRRSSSIRRQVHQKYGRDSSWGRRQSQLALANSDCSTPVAKPSRPRLATESFTPRDSPFTTPTGFMQPLFPPIEKEKAAHPLSRAFSTLSSSSGADESPAPIPAAAPAPSKLQAARSIFANSLPIGARPPMFPDEQVQTPKFAVPPARQVPASTGLVSKMYNAEDQTAGDLDKKLAMPDTPCKKSSHAHNFLTFPPSSSVKPRPSRPSFTQAGTPFNPIRNGPGGTFGKPSIPSIFEALRRPRDVRKNIFAIESEDRKWLDENTADADIPATPTKMGPPQKTTNIFASESPTPQRQIGPSTSAVGNGLTRQPSFGGNCKSIPVQDILKKSSLDSGTTSRIIDVFDSPCPAQICSRTFTRSQVKASTLANPLSFSRCTRQVRGTKQDISVASPLDRFEFTRATTPRTPQDSVIPPDPSSLSISNPAEGKNSMLPPATPTTRHESATSRRVITPVNSTTGEVDEVLINMFDKVTEIGSGEFSKVYRVVHFTRQSTPYSFLGTPSRASPSGSRPSVYAVKKLKQSVASKDHDKALKEVEILRTFQHDNVLRYTRHWVELNHLYIQTEYCEDGSLDIFLNNVGKKGRLDDFRIWKILLEVGAGLAHIHDSGFIHLDLKPANIFISFDGILKIGDFGLATSWPATNNIDGEGDREYMGPEVLNGQFDKPADIYAFGLILLEIAGNVRLPGNGPSWRSLRSGDMTEVPCLTWDANANVPIVTDSPSVLSDRPRHMTPYRNGGRRRLFETKKSLGKPVVDAREDAPKFMEDAMHPSSLDQVVRHMILPDPENRPTVHEVLQKEGSAWVASHRHAGAIVFEGQWGPKDSAVASTSSDGDTEMTGV